MRLNEIERCFFDANNVAADRRYFKERLGLKRNWNPQEDKNQSCFASLLGKGDKGDSLNVTEGEVTMGEVSEVSESLKVFSRVIWL